MSVKGLKEALAKKQAQQHPEQQDPDGPVAVTKPRPGIVPVPKLHKKITGRGR